VVTVKAISKMAVISLSKENIATNPGKGKLKGVSIFWISGII